MHRVAQLIAVGSSVLTSVPAIAHDAVGYSPLVGGEQTRTRDSVRYDDAQAQYRQVVAFGRCVVASDRDGSVAYVRAAASGVDVRDYPALSVTQQHCYRTVARNAWQLGSTAVRVGAVAEALRSN